MPRNFLKESWKVFGQISFRLQPGGEIMARRHATPECEYAKEKITPWSSE